jgi:hypothetical protein
MTVSFGARSVIFSTEQGMLRAGGCRVPQNLRNTPATQGANSLQKCEALHSAIFPYANPYYENHA